MSNAPGIVTEASRTIYRDGIRYPRPQNGQITTGSYRISAPRILTRFPRIRGRDRPCMDRGISGRRPDGLFHRKCRLTLLMGRSSVLPPHLLACRRLSRVLILFAKTNMQSAANGIFAAFLMQTKTCMRDITGQLPVVADFCTQPLPEKQKGEIDT